MRYTELVGVGRPVSLIVQGATSLPPDDDEAFAVLDAALASGINAFDTAHSYVFDGRSLDQQIGRWMKARGHRGQVVIVAKGCHPEPPERPGPRVTPEAAEADIAETLERMGADRLDLWLFHRDNPQVGADELVDAMDRQIAAGRIGAWGVSNWTTARISAAVDAASRHGWPPPAVNSAHLSLADQLAPPWPGVETLTGPDRAEDRDWHRRGGVRVLAWSALAGGFLSPAFSLEEIAAATGWPLADAARCYLNDANAERRRRAEELADRRGCSLSRVAAAWVLGHELAPLAIAAAADPGQAADNAAAADLVLTEAERDWLAAEPPADDRSAPVA